MGSDRAKLIAHCCYAAVTLITLSVMFWIAWCLFGLTAVQMSDAQRRAFVNYSPSAKNQPPATTPSPASSTTLATVETSANSISKQPTAASLGQTKWKDLTSDNQASKDKNATTGVQPPVISSSRDSTVRNEKPRPDERASILAGSSIVEDGVYSGSGDRPEDRPKLAGSTPDPRYELSSTRAYDSRPVVESSRRQEAVSSDRSRSEDRTDTRAYSTRDEAEPPRRYDIQSSRRPEYDSVDREPPRSSSSGSDRGRTAYDDDEKEYRGRYDITERRSDDRKPPPISEDRFRDRGNERYPDGKDRRDYDDKYDDRDDRFRPSDRDSTRYRDRDTEVRPPPRDDRYRDEEQYRSRNDERSKDRDGDRYRSRGEERDRYREDERYRDRDADRYRDRDADRYRDRGAGRYRDRDDDWYRDRGIDRDRYRDDDRYRDRVDDRYIDRDGERYIDRADDSYRDRDRSRDRDDDRYRDRDRDSDRYRGRDDDRSRDRDDDRYYRDDDKYKPRDDDKNRQEENYRVREDDRYKSRDDERYRTDFKESPPRIYDISTSRIRDTNERESSSRRSSDTYAGKSRYESSSKGDDRVSDYDLPVRDSSKIRRPVYDDDERYRGDSLDDENKRPSRYQNDRAEISPTRTFEENAPRRSSLIDSQPRGSNDDAKYLDNSRDRARDSLYNDQKDVIRNTRIQDSRSSSSVSDSRRYVDDADRYRTRLPNERSGDSKFDSGKEEVVLDRRSYASEDEEYRKRYAGTVDEDRNRRQNEDTRSKDRYDESYSRRDQIDDDEYKNRRTQDYERDRRKNQDRNDDEYRKSDDRYDSRDDDRYSSRTDRLPPLPVRRYDTYPDDEERARRRNSESSSSRNRDSEVRGLSARDDERSYSREEYTDSKLPLRRRNDDDLSSSDSRDYSESRRYSESSRRTTNTKVPMIESSMTTAAYWREPSEVVVREKRFQSTENRYQNSRTYNQENYDDRSYAGGESSRSREPVRPLSAREVIEAAIRHSDASDGNSRKVNYPLFDPILSNLTSPEIIRPNERRGTTISSRKRRFA